MISICILDSSRFTTDGLKCYGKLVWGWLYFTSLIDHYYADMIALTNAFISEYYHLDPSKTQNLPFAISSLCSRTYELMNSRIAKRYAFKIDSYTLRLSPKYLVFAIAICNFYSYTDLIDRTNGMVKYPLELP